MLINKDVENFWMLKWLDKYLIGHNGFICGGCFKNIFSQEQVKDIDMFFPNEEEFIKAKILFKDSEDYTLFYENKNVIAFKDKKGITIELCHKIYGTPEEILNQFDFTITKFAYFKEVVEISDNPFEDDFEVPFVDDNEIETKITYKILCDDCFFEHLHFKRLVVDNKMPYPMSTLERSYRYAKYGYQPCKETKLKIAKAINEMPISDIEVSQSLYEGHD